jgi:hypothetical protein
MYVNGKIPVDTATRIRVGEMRESVGGEKFKYKIFIYYKNFCKCYNVAPSSTTIVIIKKRDGFRYKKIKIMLRVVFSFLSLYRFLLTI